LAARYQDLDRRLRTKRRDAAPPARGAASGQRAPSARRRRSARPSSALNWGAQARGRGRGILHLVSALVACRLKLGV